jgi:hypothetical protein
MTKKYPLEPRKPSEKFLTPRRPSVPKPHHKKASAPIDTAPPTPYVDGDLNPPSLDQPPQSLDRIFPHFTDDVCRKVAEKLNTVAEKLDTTVTPTTQPSEEMLPDIQVTPPTPKHLEKEGPNQGLSTEIHPPISKKTPTKSKKPDTLAIPPGMILSPRSKRLLDQINQQPLWKR